MMRDPYLYDDVPVLRNLADIKETDLLRKAEADITGLTMTAVYNVVFPAFDMKTLCDIHRLIFGQIYDWAGEFRTIQMVKSEAILGGDTVRYAPPKEIKKQLTATMKEAKKLKRTGDNDRDVVFRMVRIIGSVWQTHPFREGNTRAVIVFAVLWARSMGFDVNHELFKVHPEYVRNALVWASQGMYAKHEYLERIFFDAILHEAANQEESPARGADQYQHIGDYNVREYQEQPHAYVEGDENS